MVLRIGKPEPKPKKDKPKGKPGEAPKVQKRKIKTPMKGFFSSIATEKALETLAKALNTKTIPTPEQKKRVRRIRRRK